MKINKAKLAILCGFSMCAFADDLQSFKNCIGSAGSGDCFLDPGPLSGGAYSINETLTIGRSNFILQSSMSPAILRRAPGFQGPLMSIGGDSNAPNSNVTIQLVTFDGNRYGGGSSVSNGELEVGPYCTSCGVKVNTFQDSPHIALAISPQAFKTDVRYNSFSGAYHFGIWSGTGNCGGDPYFRCLYVYTNHFDNIGTNAIFLTSSRANLGYNTLNGNHRECSYDAPGGQIDLDLGANDVQVFWNTITSGPSCSNQFWAQGVELHGTNIQVYDNIISGNAGEGIYMEQAQNVSIYSTDSSRYIRSNNVRGSGFPGCGGFPGVRVHSYSGAGFRPTQNISVTNLSSIDGHSWGVEVSACPSSTQNANNITVSSNCFRGNQNLGGNNGVNVIGSVSGLSIGGNVTSGCGPI